MIAQIVIECQARTTDVFCEYCFFKRACLLLLKLSRDNLNNQKELESSEAINAILCLEVGS